jgi:hypothetical protein
MAGFVFQCHFLDAGWKFSIHVAEGGELKGLQLG